MSNSPQQRLTAWLTIAACLIAALVPAGGITICLSGDHLGVGTASAHEQECPCSPNEHPQAPVEDHRDLAIDSFDAFKPSSETDSSLAPHTWCATHPHTGSQSTRDAAPIATARGPTPQVEPPRLRIARSTVLLI